MQLKQNYIISDVKIQKKQQLHPMGCSWPTTARRSATSPPMSAAAHCNIWAFTRNTLARLSMSGSVAGTEFAC